jgi:hypothetical protein
LKENELASREEEKSFRIRDSKRVPILEVEVNINEKVVEKCIIYKDDTCENVAKKLAKKYNLKENEKKLIIQQLNKHL